MHIKYIKRLFPLLALLITSCANPYAEFYAGSPDARAFPGYISVRGPLRIIQTNNFRRDGLRLLRRGYVPIGQSSFNAPTNQSNRGQIREQAKKIGAEIVLFSQQYTNTIAGSMPYQAPQTTTSYSTGTATAYGPGGTTNAYGSGTTTTYGSQTINMPYSVSRSDFMAIFYAKAHFHVGAVTVALSNKDRRRLQSNAGVKVKVIVNGSPAFRANILPGDVVLSVNGKPVESVRGYMRLLNQYQGRTVTFLIDRGGVKLNKEIYDQPYTQKVVGQRQTGAAN